MHILTHIKNVLTRQKVVGAKRHFVLKIDPETKWVGGINGKQIAFGLEGDAHNLEAAVEKHKVQLVVKVQNDHPLHNKITLKEHQKFLRLRENHFPVPPTTRLVKIKGQWYIALTDLSRFGDIQTKYRREVLALLGRAACKQTFLMVKRENARARELGLNISDSWEYVIDSKKKTVRAFVLDMSSRQFF